MNKNTFPPLVSGSSHDFLGYRQLLGDAILDTMVIQKASNDLFFNPQNGLTGFGYDGVYYDKGVRDPSKLASWFTEGPNPDPIRGSRGPLQTFPTRALVLLTDASMSILDISTNLSLWMLFTRTDTGAFTDNFAQDVRGYLPSKLSYTSGMIMITMTPDEGSKNQNGVCLFIDFMKDKAYVDYQEQSGSWAPDPHTGYLGEEINWLERMSLPIDYEYGEVTRIPKTVHGFDASGTWAIYGYTPTPSPKPVYDAKDYPEDSMADMFGYLTYFQVGEHDLYKVCLAEIDPATGAWIIVSESSINIDGKWGPLKPTKTGPRVVVSYRKNTDQILGTSHTEAWDSQYCIGHYYRPTLTDPPVLQGLTPVYASGRWDLAMERGRDPREGIWEVKLQRMVDGRVISSCANGDGLLRSWLPPTQDSNYDKLKNLCMIDDHAMGMLAGSAYIKTHEGFFVRSLHAMLRAQEPCGAWSKMYDAKTGAPTHPGHNTVSTTATCVYSLLMAMKVLPDMEKSLKDQVILACHNGLGWCKQNLQGPGPFEGLFLEGHGVLDKSGFYQDVDLPVVFTLSQVMLAGAFRVASDIIPLRDGVNQGYHVVFGNLMDAIETKLWMPKASRYAQGMGNEGLNVKDDAFTRSWTCLLPLYRGDQARFKTLFKSFWKDYRVASRGLVGFTPFNPTFGYDYPRNIWPAIGLFLDMLSQRDISTQDEWQKLCYEALEWRGFDGGWAGCRLYQNYGAVVEWVNTSTTCWAILAQHENLRTTMFT